MKTYSGIIEACEAITLLKPCIYNCDMFRILAYLEAEASSKACQTCKMNMHIQSPGIVRIVYSSIFKNI